MLTVDVDVWCRSIQAGGDVVFDAIDNLLIKLRVVDRRRKRVKIGDEHVDVAVGAMFGGESNHRQVCPEKIAECGFFVYADAG